ncbi:Uncharacterised protein [Pseudomonas aeruginosa]|nr:Uncharacterised protein [Pseudomonas aeruginosa]
MADRSGALGPGLCQAGFASEVQQLFGEGCHVSLRVDGAVAAGDFLGEGASVRGDRAAPAGCRPGQGAAGAALLAEQTEFLRLAVRQDHHVVGLDGTRDVRGGQVQVPVDGVGQAKLGDLCLQLVEVVAAGAEGHFRGGAAGQGQAHALAHLRRAGEQVGEGLEQVLDAFAAIDESEVQQAQGVQRRQRHRGDLQVAVVDHLDPPGRQAHPPGQALAAQAGEGHQARQALGHGTFFAQGQRVGEHHGGLGQGRGQAFQQVQRPGQALAAPDHALRIVYRGAQRQAREALAQLAQGDELAQAAAAEFGMDQVEGVPVDAVQPAGDIRAVGRHAGERRGYFDAETLQGVAEMTGVVGDAILFRRQGREEGDPHQNALR